MQFSLRPGHTLLSEIEHREEPENQEKASTKLMAIIISDEALRVIHHLNGR